MINKFLVVAILILSFSAITAAQEGWKTFSPADGNFSISVPCTPSSNSKQTPTEAPVFVCFKNEVSYMIAHSNRRNGYDIASELKLNQSEYLAHFKQSGYRVLTEQTVYSGKGLDFTAWFRTSNGSEGYAALRFVIDGDRVVGIGVIRPAGVTAPMEYARFFSSLTFANGRSSVARKF